MNNETTLLYRSLLHQMAAELQIHEDLLDCIDRETRTMRRGKLTEILDVGVMKEKAMRNSEAAMRQRTFCMRQIIAHLGLQEPVGFAQVVAHADLETRQELTDCREKIADITGRIGNINEINRQTITSMLDHVGKNIRFINNISSSLPNYDRHGQIRAGNLQGRMLSKAG